MGPVVVVELLPYGQLLLEIDVIAISEQLVELALVGAVCGKPKNPVPAVVLGIWLSDLPRKTVPSRVLVSGLSGNPGDPVPSPRYLAWSPLAE
jgi:hypothetical protein